jgi:hypothetical protein
MSLVELTGLPREVLLEIISLLNASDTQCLSLTGTFFFNMLFRSVYSTITLREDAISGNSILAIASGPRASFVSTIIYSPRAFTSGISRQTVTVLRELHRLPSLRQFCFATDWGADEWQASLRDSESWVRIQLQSMQALSQSRGAFSALQMRHIPPAAHAGLYDVFRMWWWQSLLRSLRSFEVTLLGLSSLHDPLQALWSRERKSVCLSTRPEHINLVREFPQLFLNQLIEAEHLRLDARHDGLYGGHINWSHVAMMPRLTSLRLEYSIINSGLIDFIVRHLGTLQKIYMRRCYSDPWASNWTSDGWTCLFRSLLQADPKHLLDFTIVHLPVQRRSLGSTSEEWDIEQEELEHGLQPEEALADGDERVRLFTEAHVDDDGSLHPVEEGPMTWDYIHYTRQITREKAAIGEWLNVQHLIERNKDR